VIKFQKVERGFLNEKSFDLKAELKSIGMTQKDFAEEIGVSRVTVSDWNRGKTRVPKIAINFINKILELQKCQATNHKLLAMV
jgi:transcriptional regulator with XRE-family HTH domain